MRDKVKCEAHGEGEKTFVCTHLVGGAAGLGFNRSEPSSNNPYPDAWCDDCELIRAAQDGWTDECIKLVKLVVLCSACYERVRIRNTRTSVTLDDLADLQWKCATCEEWHAGPCLDFGHDCPVYWSDEHQKAFEKTQLVPSLFRRRPKTFLDPDFCAIDDEDFFVRGNIFLPIIGTAKNFSWGVWGSLSRENFETLLKMNEDPKRAKLPPMFSWLSNQIPQYPDTLSLKMYAHIKELGWRPHFELELTNHPLCQEYHHGISQQRVKEMMLQLLRKD